jgi:hypothetical protein
MPLISDTFVQGFKRSINALCSAVTVGGGFGYIISTTGDTVKKAIKEVGDAIKEVGDAIKEVGDAIQILSNSAVTIAGVISYFQNNIWIVGGVMLAFGGTAYCIWRYTNTPPPSAASSPSAAPRQGPVVACPHLMACTPVVYSSLLFVVGFHWIPMPYLCVPLLCVNCGANHGNPENNEV